MFRSGLLADQSSTWVLCSCSHVLTFFEECAGARSSSFPFGFSYSGSPQRVFFLHTPLLTTSSSTTPTLSISSRTTSNHLFLGLPLFLLPASLPETTKGGCSTDFSLQSTTPLLEELGGSWELVGLGKIGVVLWGGLLLFPTCYPAFQSNSIDDMEDRGLAEAHMACNIYSLLSSSMKKKNETFSHFIQIFCVSHDCFIQ